MPARWELGGVVIGFRGLMVSLCTVLAPDTSSRGNLCHLHYARETREGSSALRRPRVRVDDSVMPELLGGSMRLIEVLVRESNP